MANKKFWGDVLAFIVAVVCIGGFTLAVGDHYLNEAPPVSEDAAKVRNEAPPAVATEAPTPVCESEYGESDCVYLQGGEAWLVTGEDTAEPVTVYEDGSWVAGDRSGCLAGGLCED